MITRRPCGNPFCLVGKTPDGKCILLDRLQHPTQGDNLPDDRESAVATFGPKCTEMDKVTNGFPDIVDGAKRKGLLP